MSIATWLSIGLSAGARYHFVQKNVVHRQACQQEHQPWQTGVRVNVANLTQFSLLSQNGKILLTTKSVYKKTTKGSKPSNQPKVNLGSAMM